MLLHDKSFIQWKPTIVNWAMAAALIGSHFFASQNLTQRMLGSQLDLPSGAWTRLNFGWAFGFLLAGALNLYVARNYSEAFWVNYKLFGGVAITLLYMAITIAYLALGGHLANATRDPSKNAGTPLVMRRETTLLIVAVALVERRRGADRMDLGRIHRAVAKRRIGRAPHLAPRAAERHGTPGARYRRRTTRASARPAAWKA